MNIEPISCFTCGKILGNLWSVYESEVIKNKTDNDSFLNISRFSFTTSYTTLFPTRFSFTRLVHLLKMIKIVF